VIIVARKDTILVYASDPRWYVTAESDLGTPPKRRWWGLWWQQLAHGYTRRQDPDELVKLMVSAGLDPDPERWRQPMEEELRPRRDG
jgi:hypothetical protein